jgi:hypothetical protein
VHISVGFPPGGSRSKPGSSAHQDIQNATQRVTVDITIDPDAMSAVELDLDDALGPAPPRAYFVYVTSPSITNGSDRISFIGTQLWVLPCVSVATTL